MAATPELVVDCRGALLENALWVPETGLLWFLDLLGPAVHRYDPASGRHERHELDGTKPWAASCADRATRASSSPDAKASSVSTRPRSP